MDKEAVKKDIDKLVSIDDPRQFVGKLHKILNTLVDCVDALDLNINARLRDHMDTHH